MWRGGVSRPANAKKDNCGLVVVAVDADRSSQHALKWAADHLIARGQIFHLLHVRKRITTFSTPTGQQLPVSDVDEDVTAAFFHEINKQTKDLLLPFQCFCSRRGLQCKEVILEESDVPKAIIDYLAHQCVDKLVLGASNRNAFTRTFKQADVPTSVSKLAPEFCSIYVIAKGKISSIRPAPHPNKCPLNRQSCQKFEETGSRFQSTKSDPVGRLPAEVSTSSRTENSQGDATARAYAEMENERINRISQGVATTTNGCNENLDERVYRIPQGVSEYLDFSYKSVSSCPSPSRSNDDQLLSYALHGRMDSGAQQFVISSTCDEHSYKEDQRRSSESSKSSGSSWSHGSGSSAYDSYGRYSPTLMQALGSGCSPSVSQEAEAVSSCSSNSVDEMNAEMRRLKLEIKKTRDIYNRRHGNHMDTKLKEHRFSGEEPPKIPKWQMEMTSRNGMATNRLAKENNKMSDDFSASLRYRRYSIEEILEATDSFSDDLKIGEGGYGPVFKSNLDHTLVAIKVLRSNATQGMRQFEQEIEVLSCIRHPNMVRLVGACPENGSLVYEYMSNGSLEDHLFRLNNSPLSWQLRFKIAAEIATGLHFLHNNKPEPLVHRDLKPGNILLDHKFVSKIADVGLARLVPPSVADSVTQYRLTAAAGTFCYIDPEYQKTGMLCIKSDIYALGIILLQLITGKPPMGLVHSVEDALEIGKFEEILDPSVPDWPIEETITFAKLSLKCAELQRKDRPELGSVVLPQLNRLRALANDSLPNFLHSQGNTRHRQVSLQNLISMPCIGNQGFISENGMGRANPLSAFLPPSNNSFLQ